MSRTRSFVFTLNNYTHDELALLESLGSGIPSNGIKFLLWGEEVGPTTGTPHLQGMVEFAGARRLNAVRLLLGGRVFLEQRRGTFQESAQYCRKGGVTREFGVEPQGAGHRSDLDMAKSILEAGGGLRSVAASVPSYQALRYAQLALCYLEPGRSTKPRVFWFWGRSGLGKSRKAVAMAGAAGEEPFILSGSRWFDGYDAHKFAILDDFRPEILPFAFFLRLLDRYPVRVEIKGGSRQWLAETIVVTSVLSPRQCVPQGEDGVQLCRRIDVEEEFVNEWVEEDVVLGCDD